MEWLLVIDTSTLLDLMLGLGISFGVSFIFTAITEPNAVTFALFYILFSSVIVYTELLPIWVIYANLIILSVIAYIKIKGYGVE